MNIERIKVQVYNKSHNDLPIYATEFAAGIDLKAMVDDNARILIYPGKRELIHTGLYVAIPEGYEIQIRPRSGMALKQLITVLNTPGTIDSDYRGEIGVILINHGEEAVGISNGDRIAQAVIAPVNKIEWDKVNTFEELPTTDRAEGGFGSTGFKSNSDPDVKLDYMDNIK